MKRRRFLGLLGSLAASVPWARTARADKPLHVIVVGTGPAGFSAALELVEKGVRVTLLEADQQVGGKVKGWTESLDGEAVDVEHGIHGLAEGYVHFTDLLERHGLADVLVEAKGTDAALRTPEGEFPLWGLGRIKLIGELRDRAKEAGYPSLALPYLKGRSWVRKLTRPAARKLLGGKSVAEWYAESGVPLTRYRLLPRVTALSLYFVEPEQLDAGMFAISERWNGLAVRWMRGNPQTLIWEPLADTFRRMRGRLYTNTRVRGLIIEDGRVVGVRVGERERSLQAEAPLEGWTAVEGDADPVFLGRVADGSLLALRGRCTHAGCAVELAADGFACPCHGGRYDFGGHPTAGPPEAPLERVRIDPVADGVRITLGGSEEELRADAVILAVDAESFGELVAPVIPQATGLANTGHWVARFWFDIDVDSKAKNTVLIGDYAHSCNGFLVHRMQDAARAWAAATGGSLIEIQAFKDIPADAGRDALLDAIEADVRAIWPELAEATVLKRTLAQGRKFTWFKPGWHLYGVGPQTKIPGLYAAGDHLVVDRDCEFMERAVMTGRMAANSILEAHGLPPAPILPPIGLEKRRPADGVSTRKAKPT